MNADKKYLPTLVAKVDSLTPLGTLPDGAVLRYVKGIQFETLRDSFEHHFPSKTLIPLKIGSEGYTTYGANSCFILYK